MQKRTLGNTGQQLSAVGFGGLVVRGVTPEQADRTVGQAIERGINYFDVAPAYGNAEEMLGPALEPYRREAFLACKTGKRTRDEARIELDRSLQRLRTDCFDLYQFHGVSSLEDAERILGPGGAMEAFVAAREAGKIRHIGFSAHDEEAALRLLDAFPFDSMLAPVNRFCWEQAGFGVRMVERAVDRGTGVLALKSLARRPWNQDEQRTWPNCWYCPIDDPVDARAALAFTLSRPVTAAVAPGHAELLWLACDAVEALETQPGEAPQEAELQGTPIFPQ